ncbi:hypothetical protein D3C83_266050 [compost metagenome]
MAELAHDLEDMRDAEHVGVRQHAAVRVVGQRAGVEVEPVAGDERPRLALGAEAHVFDLHQ